jgi:signal transduction histidine kinase
MTHQQETFCIDDLLNELLITVKQELQNAEKSHIDVETYQYSDDHTCSILADRELLRQVLVHLLDNAVKSITRGFIVFGYHLLDDNLVDFFVDDTRGQMCRDSGVPDLSNVRDLLQQMGSRLKKTTIGLSFSVESAQVVLNLIKEKKIA